MKVLILLLSIFCHSSIAQDDPFLECRYSEMNFDGRVQYGCLLNASNPDGLDNFESVRGLHLQGRTNEEVTFVLSFDGETANVPQIICQQFPNVEYLDVSFFGVRNITETSFGQCSNVHWLRLWYNPQIGTLPANAFQAQTNLTYIDLDNIGLTEIPETIFANNPLLEMIELENNQLVNMPERVLNGLTRLDTFLIYFNRLAAFNPNWFTSNPNLLIIDVYGNNLQALPENAFVNVPNLLIIDLGFNPIFENIPDNTFRNVPNLDSLFMSETGVKVLNPAWFEPLQNLTLVGFAFDIIEDLQPGLFRNNNQLMIVNFWENQLKVIRRNVFGSVSNLVYLDFDENFINGIERQLIDDAQELRTFYFSRNICASGVFFSFHLNRVQHMQRLQRCFYNFEFIVETQTEGPEFSFIRAPTPGIQIRVRSSSNVQIALTPFNFEWTPMIEIIIGANNNTRTIIRRNSEENVVVLPTTGILSNTQWNDFRITWANHNIMVFRDGDRFPFLAYTMADIYPVNFYGLRTPDMRSEWSIAPLPDERDEIRPPSPAQ